MFPSNIPPYIPLTADAARDQAQVYNRRMPTILILGAIEKLSSTGGMTLPLFTSYHAGSEDPYIAYSKTFGYNDGTLEDLRGLGYRIEEIHVEYPQGTVVHTVHWDRPTTIPS